MKQIKVTVSSANGIEIFFIPIRRLTIRKIKIKPKFKMAIFIKDNKWISLSATNHRVFYKSINDVIEFDDVIDIYGTCLKDGEIFVNLADF